MNLFPLVVAFWIIFGLIVLIDAAGHFYEKWKLSRMSHAERAEYLMNKYGKNFTDYL